MEAAEEQRSHAAQRVQAVLEGLREVIQALHTEPTEPSATEYFAAALTALASADNTHLNELVVVLESFVQSVPDEVLRSSFEQVAQAMVHVLTENEGSENNTLNRHCLTIIGVALTKQETSRGFWSAPLAKKCVNALLAFVDSASAKTQKAVHTQLTALMKRHKARGLATVVSYIGEFCLHVMQECTRSDYRRTYAVLRFLSNAAVFLPTEQLIAVLERILMLPSCAQPVLTAAACFCLDNILQSHGCELPAEALNAFTLSLMELQLNSDAESIVNYCGAVASAVVLLLSHDEDAAIACVAHASVILVGYCESDYTQVHCAVTTGLKRLIQTFTKPDLVALALENQEIARVGGTVGKAQAIFDLITAAGSLLQLQYQRAWIYVLDAVRYLLEKLPGDAGVLCHDILLTLMEIYKASVAGNVQLSTAVTTTLEETIGAAVRTMGVARFLQLLPLHDEEGSDLAAVHHNTSLLAPIIREQVKRGGCQLLDFQTRIYDVIGWLETAVDSPAVTANQAAIARLTMIQLWSTLPSFFHHPSDLPHTLPSFAPVMISLLQNDAFPELLEIVCQSLQAMCSNALQRNPTKQQSAEFAAIAEQAKHFLPILFNLVEVMETSDPRYQSVSDAIAHYAKCAPESLLTKMFKKLVQRLLAATTAENLRQADKAAGYLNLAAAIAPSLSMECVELLFRAIKPLISLDDVSLVQKRAYKVLVALLDSRATDLLQGQRKVEILELLTTALLTCHVSARTMRMRCLQGVFRNGVEADEAYEIAVSIAGEVIMSLKDSNSKAREAAKELYLAMARIIGFDRFFQLVPAGLAASTTHMRSGTVLALTLLLKEFASEKRDELLSELIPAVVILVREQKPEETKAVLTFLRVCVGAVELDTLQSMLPMMMAVLFEEVGPLKDKFVLRIKAIILRLGRKLGFDALRGFIPESDQPLLTHIERQERRHQKNRERAQAAGGDAGDDGSDDSDLSDDDSDEDEEVRIQRPKVTVADDTVGHSEVSQRLGMLNLHGLGGETVTVGFKDHNSDDEDDDFEIKFGRDGRIVVATRDRKAAAEGSEKPAARPDASTKRKRDAGNSEPSTRRPKKLPGDEYKSEKAGGDVWRKGSLQPYAYIPLDPKMFSKKQSRNAHEQYGHVVQSKRGGNKKSGRGRR